MEKELKELFLSDDRVRKTTEYVPWAEGSTLDSFLEEVETVENAVKQYSNEHWSSIVRTAFILRAFYLLGVQRGAEDWRCSIAETINDEAAGKHLDPMPFALDSVCADDAVDDYRISYEEVENALHRLGLSI